MMTSKRKFTSNGPGLLKYFKVSEELTQPEDSSGGEDDVAREEARGDVEVLARASGEPKQVVQSDVIVKITVEHFISGLAG